MLGLAMAEGPGRMASAQPLPLGLLRRLDDPEQGTEPTSLPCLFPNSAPSIAYPPKPPAAPSNRMRRIG